MGSLQEYLFPLLGFVTHDEVDQEPGIVLSQVLLLRSRTHLDSGWFMGFGWGIVESESYMCVKARV